MKWCYWQGITRARAHACINTAHADQYNEEICAQRTSMTASPSSRAARSPHRQAPAPPGPPRYSYSYNTDKINAQTTAGGMCSPPRNRPRNLPRSLSRNLPRRRGGRERRLIRSILTIA